MSMKKNCIKNGLEADEKRYKAWLYLGSNISCAGYRMKSLNEDIDKIGLFSAAQYLLWRMRELRLAEDFYDMKDVLIRMALCSTLVVTRITSTDVATVREEQLALYKKKNRRYGNSFAECYKLDGKPYAFGHLQEKINRICSLLVIDDDAVEEPILDSFRDLFGYCLLTLCEIEKEYEK